MAMHARPLAGGPVVRHLGAAPAASAPLAETPPPTAPTTEVAPPMQGGDAPAAAPAAARTAPAMPWYRSEPWLPIALSAFAPVGVAIAVTDATAKAACLAAAALLLALAVGVLARDMRRARAVAGD